MNLTKKGKSRYHYRDIGAIISRNSRYVQTSKKKANEVFSWNWMKKLLLEVQ